MAVAENPCLMGMPSAMAAIVKFEQEIVTQLLTNSESWLRLNQTHLDKLQDFQNGFLRKFLAVSQSGTPKEMIKMDG